jgi:hypothetical protein
MPEWVRIGVQDISAHAADQLAMSDERSGSHWTERLQGRTAQK